MDAEHRIREPARQAVVDPGAAVVVLGRRLRTLAVLLWRVAAGAAVVQAQVIRWKFRAGDVLRYTTEQTTVDDHQGDGAGDGSRRGPRPRT